MKIMVCGSGVSHCDLEVEEQHRPHMSAVPMIGKIL